VWYKDPAGTPRSRENDFEAPPGERGRRPATDEGPRAVERIDGGKLRATCATWDDAVVIYPARRWPLGVERQVRIKRPSSPRAADDAVVILRGEALTLVNIERQVHVRRAKAPVPPQHPLRGPSILGEDDFRGRSRRGSAPPRSW
jgi:hypothetical protein